MTDSTLAPELVELLTAIRDALTLPNSATVADHEVRADVLDHRASDTKVIVASLLKSASPDLAEAAETLRTWTAEHPAAYTPMRRETGGAL